eukprot:COSAG02_NODE_219_length_28538_cov_79.322058_15_plen_60_part_00
MTWVAAVLLLMRVYKYPIVDTLFVDVPQRANGNDESTTWQATHDNLHRPHSLRAGPQRI